MHDPTQQLRALVRGEQPQHVPGLVDAAREHGLLSLLGQALPDDPEVAAAAQEQHEVLERALLDLPAVVAACVGTVWAVVRCPVLAEVVYVQRRQRDVDGLEVLVSPECFEDAVRGLTRAGGRLLDANWALVHLLGRSALRFQPPAAPSSRCAGRCSTTPPPAPGCRCPT